MADAEPWTCPTCASPVSTKYCAQCGESRRDPRDLTLRGLLLQAFQAVTSLDGKVLRSLRCLVTRPGALSTAFEQGRRRPFMGPIPLFFLANVVFFGFQSLTPFHVLSSPLASHLRDQNWRQMAQGLVQGRLDELGTTLADYAPLFDRAVLLHAKSLVILMVVPFALLLPLVFPRPHRPFAAHAVFALHAIAFLLLLMCALLAIAGVIVLAGGPGLEAGPVDASLSLSGLGVCVTYLFLATGEFYGTSGWRRCLRTLGLTAVVAAIVLGYRFTIFLITLYST